METRVKLLKLCPKTASTQNLEGEKIKLNHEIEGKPNAPFVILVSGLGGDLRVWYFLTELLKDQYRLLVLDNRDSGLSERANVAYSIKDMAEDLVNLMEDLEIEKAHLIGYSMGGAIAQEVAINHPELIDRLVLLATYDAADPRGAELLRGFAYLRKYLDRETYLKLTLPWGFTHKEYQIPGLIDSVVKEALEDRLYQEPEAFERQMEATISFNSRGRLQLINSPTLLIFGEEDTMTPLRFAREMVGAIKQARLVTFEGTGHLLLRTHLREIAGLVRAFLGNA